MMCKRGAFTLVEVLISIALLGIIVSALFSIVHTMKISNLQLADYLKKSKAEGKGVRVLYLDILGSDGNFTIKKGDQTRFCIEQTTNSLYGLPLARVCWLVLKEDNTLTRIEGNGYKLPLRSRDRVELDRVMRHIEHFDVERNKDKVLVAIKQKASEPIAFMLQGIHPPTKPKKKKKSAVKKKALPNQKKKPATKDQNKSMKAPPKPAH